MGFISRLRKVTGKAAEEQEARIKARDAAGLADVEALLDAELDALQAQAGGGDGERKA